MDVPKDTLRVITNTLFDYNTKRAQRTDGLFGRMPHQKNRNHVMYTSIYYYVGIPRYLYDSKTHCLNGLKYSEKSTLIYIYWSQSFEVFKLAEKI